MLESNIGHISRRQVVNKYSAIPAPLRSKYQKKLNFFEITFYSK